MESTLHSKSSVFDGLTEPARPVFVKSVDTQEQRVPAILPRRAGENSVALAMAYETPNVPDNPITSTVVQSVMHSGKPLGVLESSWRTEHGKLVFSASRTNGTVEISVPDTTEHRAVLEKSDTLLDTFGLCCMAGCQAVQVNEPVVLHMSELLSAKGFSGYGEARKRIADKIAQDILFLGAMFVRVQDLPQLSEGKKKKIIFVRTFSGQFMECARLDVDSPKYYDTYWSMRFGLWANHYLNPDEFYWFSRLPKEILQWDYRVSRPKELIGKKLGYAFVGFSEGSSKKPREMRRRVGSVLQAIGELPVPEHRGKNWGKLVRQRFENGLGLLEDQGIVAEHKYTDTAFVEASRYYMAPWLNSNLVINLNPSLRSTDNGK